MVSRRAEISTPGPATVVRRPFFEQFRRNCVAGCRHVPGFANGYNERMAARDPMKTAGPSAVKLTYDDFVLFPDDGKRHELIDGEHYVTPAPNIRHQVIVGNLYLIIAS